MSDRPPEEQNSEPPAGSRVGAPPRRSARDTWWPAVDTPATASKTSRHGFWAAVINILLTGTVFVIALGGGQLRGAPLTIDMVYLSGAELALFVPIAWGLWRHMPVAAIAALLIYAASEVAAWTWLNLKPDIFAILLVICFVLFFTHGVRGSLALSRFRQTLGPGQHTPHT
jgi:hypothetical protein